jgi:hypothetical protein
MFLLIFALRFLALVVMAIWFGGFTFYGAVVIPALHDVFGSVEAGQVTQRVTTTLNVIGVVAIAAWWLLTVAMPRDCVDVRGKAQFALLAATTALLVFLIVLHREMDRRLDAGILVGFYPLHRVYLIASTVQWFVNLGLLAVSLGDRSRPPVRDRRDQPLR